MVQAFACTSETVAGLQSTLPTDSGQVAGRRDFSPPTLWMRLVWTGKEKPSGCDGGNLVVCHNPGPEADQVDLPCRPSRKPRHQTKSCA